MYGFYFSHKKTAREFSLKEYRGYKGKEIKMDYYTVKDVMERTGTSRSYSYKLIVTLLKEFKKEYPDSITLKGKFTFLAKL